LERKCAEKQPRGAGLDKQGKRAKEKLLLPGTRSVGTVRKSKGEAGDARGLSSTGKNGEAGIRKMGKKKFPPAVGFGRLI